MQQPYRQMVLASGAPMTCLDPPRAPPCAEEPPRAAKLRKLWSLAPVAFFFALVATPALAVVLVASHEHAGKIELGPQALARLRASNPATTQRRIHLPPSAPPPPAAVTPPRTLAPWFASSEHDPQKIIAGARRVQAMGVDLTVVDVELARSTVDCFDTFGYWPAVALPSGTPSMALDLGDLPSDSPAIAAGLQKHDVLLSIDGYSVDAWSRQDMQAVRGRGSLALEIERSGRRILLNIHWRTKWGRA